MIRFCLLMFTAALLLSACAPAGGGDPADAVEGYLQAKIEGNRDRLAQLICLGMEADLSREVSSFASVSDVHIEDMSCEYNEAASAVQCSGQIVATYGAEDTTFPLTSYQVVQEDGEWKWCGEAG